MTRKSSGSSLDRRRFIGLSLGTLGASMSLALLPGSRAHAAPRLGANPFLLGVASGDPTPSGAVLWTRLVLDAREPERLGRFPIPVRWRIASDDTMRRVVAQGIALAHAALAHSVHVEVECLAPGRNYWYQFDVAGEESAIGHFRTAPAQHDFPSALRFAVATCQDWPSGYYVAYRDMLQHDLDLVLHLGDYTYEYAIEESRRSEPVPEGFSEACVDLRTYRLRHTLYKLDADLQATHAAFPFVAVWDDHEVENDYSGLAPEGGAPSPEFTARRTAAYQAYYEHMPIRASAFSLLQGNLRIHRRLRFGRLAELTMLDDRQYRTDNPCGDGESLRCPAALSDDYTMLGREQEAWVGEGFARSNARWNLIGQQLLLAELEHQPYGDERYWNDAWDGYPRARARLFEQVMQTRLQNPVFFTGDWHSTFVNDLKLDFKRPESPTIATEIVTPAITTGGDATPYGPYYGPMIPHNPHIKYFDGDRRGYFVATVRPEALQLDLRFMDSVEDPNATGQTERTFIIEHGRPGVQPA